MSGRRDVPGAADGGEAPPEPADRVGPERADADRVDPDRSGARQEDPGRSESASAAPEAAETGSADPLSVDANSVDPASDESAVDSSSADAASADTDPTDWPSAVPASTEPVPDDPTPPIAPVGVNVPVRSGTAEPDGGGARPPRWARIALRGLAVAAGAFLLGYLAVALLFFPVGGEGEIVAAPDLRGRTVEEAQRIADRVGLRAERGAVIASPAAPAGAVVAQSPLPGREMARGARIRLVVSEGPRRVEVPSVDGLRADEARALLERVGFSVEVREVRSPRGRGRVLEMEPEPGASVALPATVRLTVSAGPPPVDVPRLVGMPLEAVQGVLEERGLRLGSVRYDPYAPGLLGDVAGQEPAPGESVPRGSAVTVTVVGSSPTGFEIESEL